MENDSPIAVYPLEGETGATSAFGPPPPPPPAGADNSAFGTDPAAGSYLPPSAPPSERPRVTLKTWLAGGLAAAVFGIGGFFGIQAVTHNSTTSTATGPGGGAVPGGGPGGFGGGGPGFRGGGGTVGTVTALSGSTLTLTTRNGATANVTTSSSTTVTKAVAGSVSDIKAGDHVVVQGTLTSGGITAGQVTDSGSVAAAAQGGPPGPGNDVTGTVISVGNGNFTVTATSGTVTVTTTAATNVNVIQPSSLSALAVGDTVRVTGATTNGTVAATSIESGTTGFGPGGGPGFGRGPGFGAPPAPAA